MYTPHPALRLPFRTLLVAALGLLCACGDEFLLDAAEPLDRLGGDGFYDTPKKIRGGVVGIYGELYGTYSRGNLFQLYVNRSDNGRQDQTGNDEINSFTLAATDAPGEAWSANFSIVSRSNIIIAAIAGFDNADTDPELLRYAGEARFMRALAYLNLATIFGDLPLLTEQPGNFEEAAALRREPVARIFDEVILPDLQFAVQHCLTRSELESAGDLGAATRGAANLLLAEAFLFRGRPAEAENAAEAVISSGEYALLDDYGDLWGGNDNNTESVFEIQYDFATTGIVNEYSRLIPFELRDASGLDIATAVSVPTLDLVDAMSGDPRYAFTLDTGLFDANLNAFTPATFWKKYLDFTQTAFPLTNDWNIVLLRYPDAFHLAAEAEIQQNKLAEAVAHLNVTRERVGVSPFTTDGLSQDEALDLYLRERRLEFAGEMKRWRDLLRTGRAIEVIGEFLERPISENQLVFPIPVSEIEANPTGLSQNPGY